MPLITHTPTTGAGREGPGPHRPTIVREDAKWGGQPSDLFNETAQVDVASLMAAFAAR